MEKVIKLIMNKDKSINILVNGEEKYTIGMQSRSINAEKLYEIIGFAPGNQYAVSFENEGDVDNQVLEFFTGIFSDIVDKVNTIEPNGNIANTVT